MAPGPRLSLLCTPPAPGGLQKCASLCQHSPYLFQHSCLVTGLTFHRHLGTAGLVTSAKLPAPDTLDNHSSSQTAWVVGVFSSGTVMTSPRRQEARAVLPILHLASGHSGLSRPFSTQGFPVTELLECLACHHPGEDLELRIRRLLRTQAV